MSRLLFGLLALVFPLLSALANPVPDWTHCTVDPADALHGLVLAPGAPGPISSTVYTLTIRSSSNNPMPHAYCAFELPSPPGTRSCHDAVNDGQCNDQGVCTITLRGGGCQNGSEIAAIRANGILIRRYDHVKSPDWDGASADGSVTFSDLLAFRSPVVDCHDYDNNGSMNLSDLLIFSSAYVPRHHCVLAP
jgi:hypothetical protein